eukprot:m.413872 g.413872  ORF g.413872 m.413872 type:complete len:390 (-) comp21266_c0_seq22:2939-4108(-)
MVQLIRLTTTILLMILLKSDLANCCYCGGGACSGASACRSHCLCCGRCPPPPPPTRPPTNRPTNAPSTRAPTAMPTRIPTFFPTHLPTPVPTSDAPTHLPTYFPTEVPTSGAPTHIPTHRPSQIPTISPSDVPSDVPTYAPTRDPTAAPTNTPTQTPTDFPSSIPSRLDTPAGSAPGVQVTLETQTGTTTVFQDLESSSTARSVRHIPMFMYLLIGGLAVLVLICTACYCHKRHLRDRMKQTTGLLNVPLQGVQQAGGDDVRSVSVINPVYRTINECLADAGTHYEIPELGSPTDVDGQSVMYLVPTGSGVSSDAESYGKVSERINLPSTVVVTSNILSMDNYVDLGQQHERDSVRTGQAYESVDSPGENEYAGFADNDYCTPVRSTEA